MDVIGILEQAIEGGNKVFLTYRDNGSNSTLETQRLTKPVRLENDCVLCIMNDNEESPEWRKFKYREITKIKIIEHLEETKKDNKPDTAIKIYNKIKKDLGKVDIQPESIDSFALSLTDLYNNFCSTIKVDDDWELRKNVMIYDALDRIARKTLLYLAYNYDETVSELIEKMKDTYIRKNTDYGESFSILYREDGIITVKVRLSDKYRRFMTLKDRDRLVKDEKIEDTLIDMVGYSVLAMKEIRNG